MTAPDFADPAYPLRDGRCERCHTPQDAAATFCLGCGLRLSAEAPPSLEAQERERQWTADHPTDAQAFVRLMAARQRVVRRRAAREAAPAPGQHADRRRREVLETLDYWTLRGRMLWDMVTEADARAREAYEACRSVGIPEAEIRA